MTSTNRRGALLLTALVCASGCALNVLDLGMAEVTQRRARGLTWRWDNDSPGQLGVGSSSTPTLRIVTLP
jgi:hypothetical protein